MPITKEQFYAVKGDLREQAQAFAEKAQPIFQQMGYTWANLDSHIPTTDDIYFTTQSLISSLEYQEDQRYYSTSTGRILVTISVYEYNCHTNVNGFIQVIPEQIHTSKTFDK